MEIARLCCAQHARQKFSIIQRGYDEPPRASRSSASPDSRQTKAAEDRVCYVVGVNFALCQMF
ncbi:MAG: hypothetical protein ABSD30_00510 [Candidatus Binatus sp.]